MHPLLHIALRAAREAADLLAQRVERLDRIAIVDSKPDSFLTSVDRDSDRTLIYHIRKAYPNHAIHSRVSGLQQGETAQPVWLLDPLLGNVNFASGYARFGVSVAVQGSRGLEHGVVIQPLQQDEFIASRGSGAQRNSRRIRVSATPLAGSLLGLEAGGSDPQPLLDWQAALLQAGAIPRIGGSSPLDVIDTACGRLQGGWCGQVNAVSMAAARLILQEAGGLSGTAGGDPRLHDRAEYLFSTARLFKQLIQLHRGVRKQRGDAGGNKGRQRGGESAAATDSNGKISG